MNFSHTQKLTIFTVCLLVVCGLSLAWALFKISTTVSVPEPIEAMKGSGAVGGGYLKEEDFYQRYGVSPEGLVLWLDQSDPRSYGDAENWYDMSGQGNHGAQTTASYQPNIVSGSGFTGYARSFDGSDDYVDLGCSTFDGTSGMTAAVWFNSGTLSGEDAIVAKYNYGAGKREWRMECYETDNTVLWFISTDGAFHLNGQIAANLVEGWCYAVGTWDGQTSRLYINGHLENSKYIGTMFNSDSHILTGAVGNGVHINYFDGLISEVRIYNRALTAAEIQKLYLADKPRYGGL